MLTRLIPAVAIAACLSSPLAAFDPVAMSDTERTAFREETRAYLLDNPEVLMEAIQVLEERQATEQAAGDVDLIRVNAEAIFDDGYSFVGGNPDGDVTIVEFLDYGCGYCKRAHPEIAELIASDGNIRLAVKEFPILGEESVLALRFAIAVKMVEGDVAYKVTNDLLMNMRANMNDETLTNIALQNGNGYDAKAVSEAMNSEAVREIITQNHTLAQRLKISGTPSFIFQDQMVRGYVPLDGMKEIVADLRGG